MPDQQGNIPKGGTMRLGKYPCTVKPGTKMAECYGENEIWERHRHRYEFNNDFRQEMQDAGLVISGTSPDGHLVDADRGSSPSAPRCRRSRPCPPGWPPRSGWRSS